MAGAAVARACCERYARCRSQESFQCNGSGNQFPAIDEREREREKEMGGGNFVLPRVGTSRILKIPVAESRIFLELRKFLPSSASAEVRSCKNGKFPSWGIFRYFEGDGFARANDLGPSNISNSHARARARTSAPRRIPETLRILQIDV